jgi:selenoprotein W-related protein
MAEQLLGEFEQQISRLTLIPSGGGRFEVMLDDRMVYSKVETGQHPDYEAVATPLREMLG